MNFGASLVIDSLKGAFIELWETSWRVGALTVFLTYSQSVTPPLDEISYSRQRYRLTFVAFSRVLNADTLLRLRSARIFEDSNRPHDLCVKFAIYGWNMNS